MWYNFYCAWIFSDEKYDVEKKEHLLWKIANIVAFSSRRPSATKYSPFRTCIVHKTLKVFILKCVNFKKKLSKNCFVKVKLNLDIILSDNIWKMA